MDFLVWLESNSFSNWVLTTTWVYPWVISFHSIGMGFLVGIVFMIVFRVLGFGRFPIAPLEKFLIIARIAFVVNLLSGVTLFIIDAERFYGSPTFRIKLLCIVLGAATGLMLFRMTFRDDAAWSTKTGSAPAGTKAMAAMSLVSWSGAILAGRLTAYLP
jgi:hypothetical protein